MLSLSKDIL